MRILKSKTVNFGLLLTILGGVQLYLPQLQALLTPTDYGVLTTVVGITVIVLRTVTSQPLSDK